MGRILVEQVVTTTDARAGDQAWVEDTPHARGMVAGGFWVVRQETAPEPVRRQRGRTVTAPPVKTDEPEPEPVEEVADGGVDPA